MAKVLRTAALVVGAVALVATGVGAFAVAGSALAITAASVASIAGTTATALSLGSALTVRRPTNERQGLQLGFKIDPSGPLTYVVGRTAVGGTVLHRETYGTDSHYQSVFVTLGIGPVHAIETLLADRAAVAFSGTSAVGYYNKWLWSDRQVGATPEADALGHGVTSPPFGSIPPTVPGWGASYKLSGHAAVSLTFLFDTKARRYANGIPTPAWVVQGNLLWDPRLDSTFPGGVGPCRRTDPATHVYSETPALHGLKWRLGIYQNGKKLMGVGAPIDLIDVTRIVEAANIQEANAWKVGGELNSEMDRWEALKLIEQAGGAEPVANGALMSTLQRMPRVPIGTIAGDDLADGALSVPGGRARRERLNGFRARYRSEAHGWEIVPINIVQIADYITADGGERTGSADFALVQDKDHAAQLAAYEIYDSRELLPIELPLKPRFIGYRLGDCLTVDIAELGLVDQDVVVRGRRIDPQTGVVTLRLATETAGKHAEALGMTGVAPPVPTLTYDPPDVAAPSGTDWSVEGGVIDADL